MRINRDRLGSICEVGRKKAKSRSSDAEGRGESRKKNTVVNSIKGGR